MTGKSLRLRLVIGQVVVFFFLIAMIWMDEILDIPARLGISPASPVNMAESFLESCFVVLAAAVSMAVTLSLLSRLRRLEGVVPACAYCRKIKTPDGWLPLEKFLQRFSEAQLSRSLCPDCRREYYSHLPPETLRDLEQYFQE